MPDIGANIFCSQPEPPVVMNRWTGSYPHQWNDNDVLSWMYYVAREAQLTDVSGESFKGVSGRQLCSMGVEEFKQRDKKNGQILYEYLHHMLRQVDFVPPPPPSLSRQSSLSSFEAFNSDESLRHEMDIDILIDTDSELTNDDITSSIPKCVMELNSNFDLGPQVMRSEVITPNRTEGQLYSYSVASKGKQALSYEPRQQHEQQQICQHQWGRSEQQTGDKIMSKESGQKETATVMDKRPCSNLLMKHFMFKNSIQGLSQPVDQNRGISKLPQGERLMKSQTEVKKKSKRGRKRGQISKGLHLWEFIRNVLLDEETNPAIRWEDKHEGIFRIVNSKAISDKWGLIKKNDKMTYEKFSRAMRFSRKEGYFTDIPKDGRYSRKLVFKFGPKSHGWKPDA